MGKLSCCIKEYYKILEKLDSQSPLNFIEKQGLRNDLYNSFCKCIYESLVPPGELDNEDREALKRMNNDKKTGIEFSSQKKKNPKRILNHNI